MDEVKKFLVFSWQKAIPDNLWLLPQLDKVDNKLEADCQSVPK